MGERLKISDHVRSLYEAYEQMGPTQFERSLTSQLDDELDQQRITAKRGSVTVRIISNETNSGLRL